MKIKYYFLTAVCCLFCVYTNAQSVKGDMNDDGKITMADVNILMNIYLTQNDSKKQNTLNGHEYVEIGGKKWATMNIGATTVAGSPSTCYGDYFAWGEIEPRYINLTITENNEAIFDGWKENYKAGYVYPYYPSYNEASLDTDHDPATSIFGDNWRTPTKDDFDALYKACGSKGAAIQVLLPLGTESTAEQGIYWCENYDNTHGVLFCDGKNKLFFPASGYVREQELIHGSVGGRYWSATNIVGSDWANRFIFSSSSVNTSGMNERYFGFTIRPISDQ